MKNLEETRAFFDKDTYATHTTGVVIEAVDDNYSKVSLVLDERHLNAVGKPMGAVMGTLVDFSFAVATNSPDHWTVTVSTSLNFLAVPKSDTLYAECTPIREGRHTCCYQVRITDSTGLLCHVATVNGMHMVG